MDRFRESSEALRFLTDDKGNRIAIVLPIDRFAELMEDFADLELVSQRLNESVCPIEELNRHLPDEGVL